MSQSDDNQLFSELIKKANERSVRISMRYFDEYSTMIPGSLLEIIGVEESQLNSDGKRILDYLENEPDTPSEEFSFTKFKWKLLAFIYLQDIFDGKVLDDYKTDNLFQLKYFYYE